MTNMFHILELGFQHVCIYICIMIVHVCITLFELYYINYVIHLKALIVAWDWFAFFSILRNCFSPFKKIKQKREEKNPFKSIQP